MLLDCAHLAMYQHVAGREPLDGFGEFPWDRVVELHVAGGTWADHEGFRYVEDTHTGVVLEDTWTIFEAAVDRATGLKAVVFECERNPLEACREGSARIQATTRGVWQDAR